VSKKDRDFWLGKISISPHSIHFKRSHVFFIMIYSLSVIGGRGKIHKNKEGKEIL